MNRQRTDLCELLRKICAEYYEEIAERGYSFEIEIPETPILCELDERLFTRVIGNLLSNAEKYNRKGTCVGVSVQYVQQGIALKVWDDGESMDEELTETMRGDEARKTDGGTGLGLAISREIVEKRGGSLQYQREDGRNCFVIGMRQSP